MRVALGQNLRGSALCPLMSIIPTAFSRLCRTENHSEPPLTWSMPPSLPELTKLIRGTPVFDFAIINPPRRGGRGGVD